MMMIIIIIMISLFVLLFALFKHLVDAQSKSDYIEHY